MLGENVTVIMHKGAMPENAVSSLIEASMRVIAQGIHLPSKSAKLDGWPEKYGIDFENKIFQMHQYCWCEEDDCSYCQEIDPAPNFLHKPSGLSVWWYKYIGRDMEVKGDCTTIKVADMLQECLESLKKES